MTGEEEVRCHYYEWAFSGQAIPAPPDLELVTAWVSDDDEGISRDAIHAFGVYTQRLWAGVNFEDVEECHRCGERRAEFPPQELRPITLATEHFPTLAGFDEYEVSNVAMVGIYKKGEEPDPMMVKDAFTRVRRRIGEKPEKTSA